MKSSDSINISTRAKVKPSPKYISKIPNKHGYIKYTIEENKTWEILYLRQQKIIKNRACHEFLDGLKRLNMKPDAIPQIAEINHTLQQLTGWQVERVPALIGFKRFFELLANRKFPAATFIRSRAELDYIQEPDIFHEFFGHCPLLTNQDYADFSQHYGQLGLKADKADRPMLARLYWFTIEFGLVKSDQGIKIYGGGILSSKQECCYSLQSNIPSREPFDVLNILRTFYRIDQLQKHYFVLDHLSDLQQLIELDLLSQVKQARAMGMKPSSYQPNENAAC